MADKDNLIFPIGFDLETAVQNAEAEGKDALNRLDKLFSRQPISLRIDNSDFDRYAQQTGKSVNALNNQLKDLVKRWNSMPIDKLYEAGSGVRVLSADAKKLWDELYAIVTVLKGIGQGAKEMANQSIKEIDKEIAAIERENAALEKNRQWKLQKTWNAAADKHNKETLEEEKRVQAELARIKKEAADASNREAQIQKLIVEYKLKQIQAEQAKKRASDEEYANLVRKLREEERISAEKERQRQLGRQRDQLEREWNTAADRKAAEDNKVIAESNRIRKEAEAMAQREAELQKLIVEHKLAQVQAEQAKKRASDENYANLVKQLREEERISAEKERQRQLGRQRDQLEREWNTAADRKAAEDNKVIAESNRIRKEAEAMARREAELQKLIVEHKLAQVQAEQAKKRASDENYANLVKQLREEERLSAEKAKQRAEEAHRNARAEAAAAVERERTARQKLIEAKRKQWAEEEAITRRQGTSYDALTAKLQAWQNIQNRSTPGSARWNEASEAIRRTKDQIAALTEEMARTGKAIERIRALREILAANERTMAGLNAKLSEYNSRLQGLEVGSAKFNKTAMEVARLNEELRRASQYAQDFAQKAFIGLSNVDKAAQVSKLTTMRNELAQIDAQINRLYQQQYNAGGTGNQAYINALLNQRMAKEREIANITKTALDMQLEREKQITAEKELQRKKTAELKKAAEARTAQKNLLKSQSKDLDTLTRKLQYYQKLLNHIDPNVKPQTFEKIAAQVSLLTKELKRTKEAMDAITGRSAPLVSAQQKVATQTQRTNRAFREQTTYIERLIKRMAVYASFSAVTGFVNKVREVTAEFELQKVSLGAILQSQDKANALFSEIKSFALKSPVTILDLTKYTKQLAAYKIGYEDLWETTKRLTDVSVGLGVSMDRIVLLYGQVRATGYLRASEIRQATEAGIPIVEELAKKLTKLNGELVTAKDVMDMVSKRAISFELVKEVFEDMTNVGGLFYNMQEKQGNTLYGLWAKLGDAASVMYDKIGSTELVNGAMKGAIKMLTDFMREWKASATGLGIAGLGVGIIAFLKKFKVEKAAAVAQSATANSLLARSEQQVTAAVNARTAAEAALAKATQQQSIADMKAAQDALNVARANEQAAISARDRAAAEASTAARRATNVGVAGGMLSGVASSAGIGIALVAVTSLAYKLKKAYDEAHRLNDELGKIFSEHAMQTVQQVRQFEQLADKAVAAADGTKEQQEALDELTRTYGEAIPAEKLSIENLRRLKEESGGAAGGYRELTDALREHIAVQNKQRALQAIEAEMGVKTNEALRGMRERLEKAGYGDYAARFTAEMAAIFSDPDKAARPLEESLVEALKNAGVEGGDAMLKALADKIRYGGQWDKFVRGYGKYGKWSAFGIEAAYDPLGISNWIADTNTYADDFQTAMKKTVDAQEAVNAEFDKQMPLLKEYEDAWKETTVKIAESERKATSAGEQFIVGQQNKNNAIKAYADNLKFLFGEAWDDSFAEISEDVGEDGEKVSRLFFDKMFASASYKNLDVETTKAVKRVHDAYYKLIPEDELIDALNRRFVELANSAEMPMEKMTKYWLKDGDRLEEKLKTFKDALEDLDAKIYKFEQTNAAVSRGEFAVTAWVDEEQIDKLRTESSALAMFIEVLQQLVKETSKKRGSQADPRLQTLKEIADKMAEVNREYEQLLKKEGKAKALADAQKLFASSFSQMQRTADRYGFQLPGFEVPKNVDDVQKWYRAVIDNINRLGIKNADKVLIEFGFKSDKAAIDKATADAEKIIKDLSERVSKLKTAQDFYNKILETTGDAGIAEKMSADLYGFGEIQESLFIAQAHLVKSAFAAGDIGSKAGQELTAAVAEAVDYMNERIDWARLAELYDVYGKEMIEGRRNMAKKLIEESQKELAENISNWQKQLAKAQDYEDKRNDIIRKGNAEREKIIKSVKDPQERGRLLGLSYSKQSQDLTALSVEEFKNGDDYIKVFQDLEAVSTQTLVRMKARLQEMIAAVQDVENVEGLKTLIEQLDKLQNEEYNRNPIKGITDGFKEYFQARRKYHDAQAEEAATKSDYERQSPELELQIAAAKNAQAAAQARVAELQAQGQLNTEEGLEAELALSDATTRVAQATEKRDNAVKRVKKAEQNTTDCLDAQRKSINKVQKSSQAIADSFSSAASLIKTFADTMGVVEDSELGDAINGMVTGLQTAATVMSTILTIAIAISVACWWIAAIGAAVAAFTAIFSVISNSKVRKANKEIERQKELLEDLEYAYGRLNDAADKLFGRDYLNNYQSQLKNLNAQAQAYMKQYEAEKSKGKKKDKDAMRDYLDSYRETMDEIAELQENLAAHFTGSTRTDAARQMAESWLEARASMSNTFAAIESDYKELIKNMIVEGAASRIVENALAPMWNQMNKRLQDNDMDGAIASLINGMDSALEWANDGLETMWQALEARGYDLKSLLGESDGGYTGISKEISSATSEEINALAAGINTQNYYVSHLPTIGADVAAMRQLMQANAEGAGSVTPTPAPDYTALMTAANEHLSHLPTIERHLSEIRTLLGRVIVAKGNGFAVNSRYMS